MPRALEWVDGRFGPITGLSRGRVDPGWWLTGGNLARSPVGNPFSPRPETSAGVSIDETESLRRALGEAVERYCALNAELRPERATLAEAGLVDRLPVCAGDEPCPPSLRQLPPHEPLTQVYARRLDDGAEVLLPAGFVDLRFRPSPPEPLVTLPISTGLAFREDLAAAIWSGLCEVVERDAVMCMWWLRAAGPEITCRSHDVPDELAERLERLGRARLEARFFDIATDFHVPTVFCILTGPTFPHLVVAAACASDPARACTKVLDEAVGMRQGLQFAHAHDGGPTKRPDHIHDLEDHALFYAGAPSSPAFTFLLEQPTASRRPFADWAGGDWWEEPQDMVGLGRLATHLGTQGLTVLWADLTTSDAEDVGRVVKVIVPEMVPLSPDHSIRWLGTRRLLQRGSINTTTATVSQFNPFPHPFP